jgi:hypothetical protein
LNKPLKSPFGIELGTNREIKVETGEIWKSPRPAARTTGAFGILA